MSTLTCSNVSIIPAIYKGYFEGDSVVIPETLPLVSKHSSHPGLICNSAECPGLVYDTKKKSFTEKIVDINLNSFVPHETIETMFNFRVDGTNVMKTTR